MKSLRLLQLAAETEKIRLSLLVRRQVRRLVWGIVAGVFALFLLAGLHVCGVLALLERFSPLVSCGIVVGVDAVLALLFGLVAARSSPGRLERQLLAQRQAAIDGVRHELSILSLLKAVLGLLRRK